MLLAAAYGAMSGAALGLTGGGGSVIAVPILMYGLHLSPHVAITLSLISVFITSLVGASQRYFTGQVNITAGITMIGGGIIGAPLGTWLNNLFMASHLAMAFSVLMLILAIVMWQKSPHKNKESAQEKTQLKFTPLVIAGISTGILTGLFGVGGGFLIVPALLFATKMPMKQATATSLFVISGICLAGLISHLANSNISHLDIAIEFSTGGLIGLLIASFFASRLSPQLLQKIFALGIFGLGMFMLLEQILQA